MRHLCECMNAGIGAAGSVQLEITAAGRVVDGAVDLALDGARVLLDLPAAVAGSGIFNRQLELHASRLENSGIIPALGSVPAKAVRTDESASHTNPARRGRTA